MGDQSFSNQIFFEPYGSLFAGEEASFLDISQMFGEQFNQQFATPFRMEDSPQPFQNLFQETPPREQTSIPVIQEEVRKPAASKSQKNIYKSSYHKNVCYNICQKTIKVIKKGNYNEKLVQLCESQQINEELFKVEINKIKRNFTGPKALAEFVSQDKPMNRVFVGFMKWFLVEKYLRIALNEGEMKDIKAYIEYKNQVILPLLE